MGFQHMSKAARRKIQSMGGKAVQRKKMMSRAPQGHGFQQHSVNGVYASFESFIEAIENAERARIRKAVLAALES